MVERESWVMVYLLIVGERRGRVTGPDGGGLTVEFYKSTTTLSRDTFGWVDCRGVFVSSRRKYIGVLTAGVGAVAGKVCDHALVASLLRGGGACRRGGTFAPVVWGTCGFL